VFSGPKEVVLTILTAKEIEKLRQEAQALKQIREAMGTEPFPQLLFDKVYKDDITRLRSMEEMWKSRRPPEPLDYETIIKEATDAENKKDAILKDGQRVWSLQENIIVFKDSLERLSKRLGDMKSTSNGNAVEAVITFDKDDEDTLDFVTASANLRSIIFGIETKSRFDIKQMAGNIIPAIATTNAIVAGLCVLQSFKILRGDYSSTKEVSLPQNLKLFFGYRRSHSNYRRCFCHRSHQSGSWPLIECVLQTQIAQYAALPKLESLLICHELLSMTLSRIS
jgi:ubiquitin-like 1-activating enzyme E1 B